MVGELFKRYTHLTLGLCLKYLKDKQLAEDAVMNIFEKLIEDLKKHEIHNFKSWLFTYSRNFCLMQLRKKSKEISIDEVQNYHDSLMESQQDLHPIDEKENQLQNLEKALNELKKEQKECVELFYLKEKTYIEVAEETGYELKKVKSYIQNGKRNLMIQLSKNQASIVVLLMIYSILKSI